MSRDEPPPEPTPDVDVDVIIVTHDGRVHLERAVTSLQASGGVQVRVIVVDNASVDGTVGEALRLGAQIIELEVNRGYGAAANVGLARATAPWIAVCNQDIEVEPRALATLVDAARYEELSCPRGAIVSPALVGTDGTLTETGHRLPSLFGEVVGLLCGEGRSGGRSVLKAGPSPQHCEWVSGAFLVGRRELWQTLSGFDAGYFMYMEDVDLFDRLRAAGHHCLWVPAARVTHFGGRRPIDAGIFSLSMRSRQRYWSARRGRLAGDMVFAAAIAGAAGRSLKWTLRSLRGDADARAYATMFRRAAWLCAHRAERHATT